MGTEQSLPGEHLQPQSVPCACGCYLPTTEFHSAQNPEDANHLLSVVRGLYFLELPAKHLYGEHVEDS